MDVKSNKNKEGKEEDCTNERNKEIETGRKQNRERNRGE
jgi:hypothetical protein